MDQSSLAALLQQLQGLDPPASLEAGEEPELKLARQQQPVLEGNSEQDQHQPIETVASALPKSELERLLHSLRPLESSSAAQGGDSNAYSTSYDTAYSSILGRNYPAHETYDSSPYARSGDITAQADLRKYTYVQALPVLSRLAQDSSFLDELQKIKTGQEAFELGMVDERNRAKGDLEKQLKRAQDAAEASGVSYEVDRLKKLLTATLTRFDKDALVRWDVLARDQQAKLEKLGVPCFYVLKGPDPVAQERQRKVMETLVTLLDES